MVSVFVLTGCYSPFIIENRFAPRLDDYKNTAYMATAQGDSVFIRNSFFGRLSLITNVSGTRPELVLTSKTHQLAIRASGKSWHPLGDGVIFILPVPIIPFKGPNGTDLIIYNRKKLTIEGTILSFSDRPFKLTELRGKTGQEQYQVPDISTVAYDEEISRESENSVPLGTHIVKKVVFNATFPQEAKDVDSVELMIKISEDNN